MMFWNYFTQLNGKKTIFELNLSDFNICLLYTSDAADES